MADINFIFLVLFFLVIVQSVVGVGILVIGTPFLLILNFNIIDILSILLPISILTSLLNLIFFKFNKKKLKMKINSNTKRLFFFVCLPSIFVGLYLMEIFQDTINFKYLVSFIIIVSIILTKIKKLILNVNNKIRIIFLSLIGVVHGLTNSGGTLLSLFMSSHLEKNNSRYSITFFYFFLALFQFLIFNYLFNFNQNNFDYMFILVSLPLAVFLGNYLIKYINKEKFRNLITILSLIACVFLVTNNN